MDPRPGRPAAYLVTFHTYGTWLPGDERGSVTRHHATFGEPHLGRSDARQARSSARLRCPLVQLEPDERRIVLRTIEEVCRFREWTLRAAHVRINHVHAVVTADAEPERVMGDLKAWSTRRVAEAARGPRVGTLWVRGGSTRYLWHAEHVRAACWYVLHAQGEDVRFAVGEGGG